MFFFFLNQPSKFEESRQEKKRKEKRVSPVEKNKAYIRSTSHIFIDMYLQWYPLHRVLPKQNWSRINGNVPYVLVVIQSSSGSGVVMRFSGGDREHLPCSSEITPSQNHRLGFVWPPEVQGCSGKMNMNIRAEKKRNKRCLSRLPWAMALNSKINPRDHANPLHKLATQLLCLLLSVSCLSPRRVGAPGLLQSDPHQIQRQRSGHLPRIPLCLPRSVTLVSEIGFALLPLLFYLPLSLL